MAPIPTETRRSVVAALTLLTEAAGEYPSRIGVRGGTCEPVGGCRPTSQSGGLGPHTSAQRGDG